MKQRTLLRIGLVVLTLAVGGVVGNRVLTGRSRLHVPPGSASTDRSSPATTLPVPTTPLKNSTVPSPQPQPDGNPKTNRLALTAEFFWSQPIAERPFAAFHDWAENYLSSPPAGKAALEGEGIELARARREELRALIETNPERALELAVPVRVRAGFPADVEALLEERLNGRGRLAVLGALAEPGKENEVTPIFRVATIGDRELNAFVYGRRLGEPTRDNIPLHGIAVDNKAAISENPLRVLEPTEIAGVKARVPDPICSVSKLPSTSFGEEVAADAGGKQLFFCHIVHAVQANEDLVAGEDGPPGPPAGDGGPEASTWTEGKKKVILIRVDFPDLTNQPFADATGISLLSGLDAFYTEMSYGRTGFYTNGAGSDMTPTFRMPQAAAYYGTNNYYDQLRADARSAATAAGYTPGNYDRDVICMGAVPGFGWSGLAYVGAAGAWLRSSFTTGVAGHELGHNWGLNHANYWDTSGQSVTGPGTSVEYGDVFDTMGSASAGNNHFNARYKAYLNWLTTNDWMTVTSSGTYRIYAHDNQNSSGLRALRIVKNSGTNYWVEFRQKFTGVKWLMSGAGLRWAGNGNERSQLLDTTPGSVDGKNDAAIVIGRTYSDTVNGIHITPVGKGGTSPESLDVVVNLGSFPANLPPTVSASASATNAATGVTLSFSATASDPNGDTLAYYWDFGDGNFGTNGPSQSKSWSAAGDYVVRCVVTDMKGGVASASVLVTIGAPTTFRIAGHVTTTNGPLQGARVYVSSTRMAWSDSDGSYTIVGLPAGTYTVGVTLENYAFATNFVNPVSVGPNYSGANFGATSLLATPTITSQPLSQTVNPGTNATFTVSASGTAPLNYQWRLNGTNIATATGSSYTRTNAQTTNAGSYSVLVSNPAGTTTSSNAVLTVNTAPVITNQPQSQFVVAGSNVTFTVGASGGSPLSYQWRFSGTNIPGGSSSAYTRTNVQLADGGNYTVVVTNGLGAVTSAPAILSVTLTNHTPVLTPAANQFVYAGTALVITNTATDIDSPAQSLTFALGPQVPAGATINATNGVLVWNAGAAYANTTNIVSVRVSDNGSPSLSATNTFNVVVLPPLTINSISASNGSVVLSWLAISGRTYRVQYKNGFGDTNWTPLLPDVTAIGSTASKSDFATGQSRFYRLLLY